MKTLTINGDPRRISRATLTVASLLDELEVAVRKGIAVAVNAKVVPRSRWEVHALVDGDEVEIIRATQGG